MKRFKRVTNTKQQFNLYLILSEGKKTERDYFKYVDIIFRENRANEICYDLRTFKPAANNNPSGLMNRMNKIISDKKYKRNYNAWLVFDRDQWDESEFRAVEDWERKNPRRHLAFSHPCFEYWLLLHFEDVSGNITNDEIVHRLKRHIPDYDKSIPRGVVTIDNIKRACRTASMKHKLCPDLLNYNGSTVYRLIEMLASEVGINLY